MNTPAGKPLNPIDPVADVSHERAGPERQKSEPDNDPFRSPYAPKKAHERAGAERHPVENTHDPRRPAYAPKSAKQPTVESDFGRNEVSAPPPQPAQPNSGRQERPAAGRDDETWSDLERLEAGVRRVQRNQTTAPLPRATPLAPVPRLPPAGQVFDHGLRSPGPLEPKRLVPPGEMMSRRDRLRWPVRIFITSIFAAPIAYYFSVGGWAPSSTHGSQIASVDPMAVAPSISKKEPIKAQDDVSGSLAEDKISSQRIETSRTARLSEGETMAKLQPGETGIQVSASNKTVRVLGSEDVKLLTKQGEQFAEAGDFVTARTLFQRAAEAGDAKAATALGATYDPTVLAKLGVVGIGADVEKARFWYQKAASLGSSDAKRRLDLLANR